MPDNCLSLRAVADRWGCSHSSVLGLVRSGELSAIDIRTRPTGRSHYVIPADELERFERDRTTRAPKPAARRRLRRRRDGATTEFFA